MIHLAIGGLLAVGLVAVVDMLRNRALNIKTVVLFLAGFGVSFASILAIGTLHG